VEPTSGLTAETQDSDVASSVKPQEARPDRPTRLQQTTLAWIAMVVLLAAAARFLYIETRGETFGFDEWHWVLERRGDDLDTFLEPHNGHLSLVPIAIYRLLLSLFALDVYGPYRLMVIAAHVGCVMLVFVYARPRVGVFVALLAAALILFLGPAWVDILWPFQVAWLISLGACLAALLMLDRGGRVGDLSASALLAVSLASSALGLAIALGLAVEVLWGRRSWRDGWIVAAPVGLYGLWWLTYQDASLRGRLVDAPGAVADAAAASISGLLGLAGETVPRGPGTLLEWGRPLAALATVLFVWRVVRLGRVPPRVLVMLTIVVPFWIATEWSRGPLAIPYESRYLYVGGLFTLLIAIELARGVSFSWRGRILLGAGAAAAVVSNIGTLRDAGEYLRNQSQVTRTVLGAVEISRPLVDPDHIISALPGYPLVQVEADSYFAAGRAGGRPAATLNELPMQSGDARREADRELVRIHRIALKPSPADLPLGPRPAVEEAMAGRTVADRGACIAFRPAAHPSASVTGGLRLTVPPAGVLLTAEGGAAKVSVRRFADDFHGVGRLASSVPATLRIRPDRASQPWQMRVEPTGRAIVCGLA
jgi:hypothetical protein